VPSNYHHGSEISEHVKKRFFRTKLTVVFPPLKQAQTKSGIATKRHQSIKSHGDYHFEASQFKIRRKTVPKKNPKPEKNSNISAREHTILIKESSKKQ